MKEWKEFTVNKDVVSLVDNITLIKELIGDEYNASIRTDMSVPEMCHALAKESIDKSERRAELIELNGENDLDEFYIFIGGISMDFMLGKTYRIISNGNTYLVGGEYGEASTR